MNFFAYPLNRPVNADEYRNRLNQSKDCIEPIRASDDLSVIKLNSTYLEVVDRLYQSKGTVTAYILAFMILLIISLCYIATVPITGGIDQIAATAFVFILYGVGCWILSHILRIESFKWTHYPIRFNYKKKLVHVFKFDGKEITCPWDELFFTMGSRATPFGKFWDIKGMVLAEDRKTVIDTFTLPVSGEIAEVKAYWTFIQRYMNYGPQSVAENVTVCMPVAEKRESYSFGFYRLAMSDAGAPAILAIMWLPWHFIMSLGRYFAMHTSKIPRWSAEVEAECLIDCDDPYQLNEKTTAQFQWKWLLPWFDPAGFLSPTERKARDEEDKHRRYDVED